MHVYARFEDCGRVELAVGMAWGLILQVVKSVALILFYYSFSISLTFYNKWVLMVSRCQGRLWYQPAGPKLPAN